MPIKLASLLCLEHITDRITCYLCNGRRRNSFKKTIGTILIFPTKPPWWRTNIVIKHAHKTIHTPSVWYSQYLYFIYVVNTITCLKCKLCFLDFLHFVLRAVPDARSVISLASKIKERGLLAMVSRMNFQRAGTRKSSFSHHCFSLCRLLISISLSVKGHPRMDWASLGFFNLTRHLNLLNPTPSYSCTLRFIDVAGILTSSGLYSS